MTLHATLPVLAAATLVLAIGLPLVRSWVRHGVFALELATDPVQRFVHANFVATLLAYGLWTVLLGALGPEALGVYAVPPAVPIAGLVVAGVGLLVVVLAQAQMGRSWRIGIPEERLELVTGGLFRFCRNPIYLGLIGVVIGVALVAPSGWTVMGVVLVYLQVGVQARAEEAFMLAHHGEAYRAWASRVGRFVPGLGRL